MALRLHTGLPWAPGLITGGRLTTSRAACDQLPGHLSSCFCPSVAAQAQYRQTDAVHLQCPQEQNMEPRSARCAEAPAGESRGVTGSEVRTLK